MAGRMEQTLILVLLLSIAVHGTRAASCDSSDGIALSYFLLENPLGGPILNQWQPGSDCCTWPGITCNNLGKVQALSVVNTKAPSYKPPATSYQVASGLGALDALNSLVLKNVSLNGNIPAAWGNLVNLQTLDVEQCNLIGTLPDEICNLVSLTTLNLANNYLNGTLPGCVGNMTSVTTFNLSGNQLTGPVPSVTAAPPASS